MKRPLVVLYQTGAKRDARVGKGRYDLLLPEAIEALAKHLERTGAKHGERNYEKGMPLSRFADSALRHLFQMLEGRTDEDHAVSALWNLAALVGLRARIRAGRLPEWLDDLPNSGRKNASEG